MVDTRAVMAAANNADLYEAIFRAHGTDFKRSNDAFIGREQPPPYYSNLTVLRPDRGDQIVGHLRDIGEICEGGIGFKDSFSEYDLRDQGFRVLFEAAWLWRPLEPANVPEGWSRIDNPSALQRWENAWKASGSPTSTKMFPEILLATSGLAFFAKFDGPDVIAGCIGNVSADSVGVSNIFSVHDLARILVEAAAAVASWVPHLPMTGYAAGAMLSAAIQNGFEQIGKLRVQLADDPRL